MLDTSHSAATVARWRAAGESGDADAADIRFHTETGQGETYALVYRARVGTQPFEEAQLLRLDDTHTSERSRSSGVRGRPSPP
ncbi:hypothetical protein K1W54_11340 [Micromonospora sp. CPCC 205371]|nr:hypothetical protein [Micromonospora sp. CPCC 205371]